MSDLLQPFAPTDLLPDGHYGRPGAPGVTARVLDGVAAATLATFKGQTDALVSALGAAGIALEDAPKARFSGPVTAIGTGPGRWMILCEGMSGRDLLARLASATGGRAALTDQSDASLLLEISGPNARDVLAKGVALDLHPGAFRVGDAATTSLALIGTTFWMCGEAPAYRFLVARSFAPAFLRWLAPSAAEFGLALSGAARG